MSSVRIKKVPRTATTPDAEREERRHDAPEDHDQREEDERRGDELGALEVLLGAFADLARGLGPPGDDGGNHRVVPLEARREPARGLDLLVVVPEQRRHDEGLVPVAAAERVGVAQRPVRRRTPHARRVGQRGGEGEARFAYGDIVD